jgi:hypothetical protein
VATEREFSARTLALRVVAGLMITILVRWRPVLFWGPLSAIIGGFWGALLGASVAPAEPRLNGSRLGEVFTASLSRGGVSRADASPADGG